MSFSVQTAVLSAAVAAAGTVVIAYPAGTAQANFIAPNAATHTGFLIVNDNDIYPEAAAGVRVNFVYNAGDITVTNNTGVTWPAGSLIRVQLGRAGNDRPGFQRSGGTIAALTAATGTAGDTIADVTGSFVQATLNNNFASLAQRINALTAEVRANSGLQ